MPVETALVQLLTERGNVGDRVTPFSEVMPTTQELPRATYHLINYTPDYTDEGPSLEVNHYQIDVFANKAREARAAIRQLMRRFDALTTPGLDSYRGTVGSTVIRRIYFDSFRDGESVTIPGKNQAIARATVDLRVVCFELDDTPPAGGGGF